MNKNDKRPPRFALVIVIIFIALMIGVGLIGTLETVLRWLIIAGLMIAFLAVIGIQVTGLPAAILIDSRYNKMSLSRLQITLWTILVLSAYFTIALDRNIPGLLDPKKGLGEPLNISFPPELLVALGISAASFAGSSLIKSVKMGKEVNIELRESQMKEAKEAVNKASKTVDKAREELTKKVQALENAKVKAATAADRKQAEALVLSAEKDRDQAFADVKTAEADLEKARKNLEDIEKTQKETEGLLHRNTDPAEAQWVDIFRGEEIGNYKLDFCSDIT